METELERVEGQYAADRDDELAVDHEPLRRHLPHRLDYLGEVTPQRPARLGHERHLVPVAEGEAAEAVPFGLELPAFALRQRVDQLRLHRRKSGLDGESGESGHGRKTTAHPASSTRLERNTVRRRNGLR